MKCNEIIFIIGINSRFKVRVKKNIRGIKAVRNESAGRTQLGRNTFNGQIKDKDVFMLKIALPRVATRTHLPTRRLSFSL